MTLIIFTMILNAFAINAFMRNTEYEWMMDERPDMGFRYKQLLWKVRYYSEKYLGEFWSKPVCTCPLCMASLHSTYFYAFFFYFFTDHASMWLWFYPLYILSLSFVSHVTNLIVTKLEN